MPEDVGAWLDDRYPTAALAVLVTTILLSAAFLLAGRRGPRDRLLVRAARLIVAVTLAALAGTAIVSIVAFDELSGWLLLLHVAVSGPFLACFALVAALDGRVPGLLPRTILLVALVAGVATAGSMLVSTLPWLPTAELECLLVVHRWSGLVLVVTLAGHLGLRRRSRN